MAALDFPAAPVVNQTFGASNGVTYLWTGTLWRAVGVISPDPGGDFFVTGAGALMAPPSNGTFFTMKPATAVTGNSGGWYNPATGVFTPPAGRYRLFAELTFYSSSSNMQGQLKWRKNGANIISTGADSAQNTAGGNLFGSVTAEVIVDANGTDTFDCQSQSNVLMSAAWGYIGAYPLSGIKGPPGDVGGARSLYSEAIAAAGNPIELVVNVPVSARSIELEFDLTDANGSDQVAALQIKQGATIVAAANYTRQAVYGAGNAAGGAYETGQTYWNIGGASSTWHGTLQGVLANTGRTDNVNLHGVIGTLGTGQPRGAVSYHFDYYFGSANQRQTITAFRFSCGVGFAVGSAVRAYALI
jgi:hypothetical protein